MTIFAKSLFAASLFVTSALPALSASATDQTTRSPNAKPMVIEVAFVLDTTGSMVDLIDGAKKKIWSIADEIRQSQPNADIRFALVGYRDRGDLYVTEVSDLTDDLHNIYGKLVAYQADGGGDWPESVNEALNVAVTRLDWSKADDTKRIVFLVGDAPPHMDYAQDVSFADTLKIANREKIIVNAVQAGNASDTEIAWRSIASLGEGDYITIPQSGNVSVVETPYDQDIQKLQLQLNLTVVPYGDQEQRSDVEGKLRLKSEAPASAASDMASYENRPVEKSARKVVTGAGDLVGDVLSGAVDITALPSAALPDEYQRLSPEEKKAAVQKKVEEREAIQDQIVELVGKRDQFLKDAEAAKPADEDSFDGAVKDTLSRLLK